MQTNGRFGYRQGDEHESESRRDHDRRPKWAARDRNDQEIDEPLEDTSRGQRRNTESRSKLAGSWFRKDNGDAEDDRTPDWRRSKDRDWDRDRFSKPEADPEWMDAVEPEESFQAHTQEDFQKWKERMKAGGDAALGKIDTSVASPPPELKSAKRIVSAEPDDSMDKFMARFKPEDEKPATIKTAGKTRFASIFSPSPTVEQPKQPELTSRNPTQERPVSAQNQASSNEADQAGFARIMEMLHARSNNPTPQSQDAPPARSPLYARASEQNEQSDLKTADLLNLLAGRQGLTQQQSHEDREARPQQDLATMFNAQNTAAYQQQAEQGRRSAQEQRPDDTRSSLDPGHTRQQSSINKDQTLLNLLKQASLAPKPEPPQPPSGSGMFAGMHEQNGRLQMSRANMISPAQAEPQSARRAARGGMFDESPISMYPTDQPQEHTGRRATNGGQMLPPEDPLIALLRGQPLPRQQQPPPQVYPPGLQQPPGFDQPRQPAAYAQQQPRVQAIPVPRQPTLPPGFTNMPRQHGQPPQFPTQQPQQQRPPAQQQPQRKYTNESSNPPQFPPGMYPPPGFMAAGPPPGFPGTMGNHPSNRFGGREVPGAQQGFVDMYGDGSGRGPALRGGAHGGPPPYR
jgi:hypothetical protein